MYPYHEKKLHPPLVLTNKLDRRTSAQPEMWTKPKRKIKKATESGCLGSQIPMMSACAPGVFNKSDDMIKSQISFDFKSPDRNQRKHKIDAKV